MMKNKILSEQKKGSGDTWHIFDNTFITMCSKMGIVMIPLLNERLGTNYSLKSEVIFLSEKSSDNGIVRCQDCKMSIDGNIVHAECQSYSDGNIIIRFMQYEFPYALDNARKEKDGKLHIIFPQPLLIQLRGKGKPMLGAVLEMAGGECCNYDIPVIYVEEYSLEEIFHKKLYMLLPYYILRYEKEIKVSIKNNGKMPDCDLILKIKKDLIYIITRLYSEVGKDYETWGDAMLMNMESCIENIVNYVLYDCRETVNYDNLVRKETKNMGGTILKLPSDELREEGVKMGVEIGIKGAIELLREVKCSDSEIKDKIMRKYNLSVEQAEEYMAM